MGKGYITRRGGSGMGFRLIAAETTEELPQSAMKNTLAVISGIPAGRLYIQGERPESPLTGDVWTAGCKAAAFTFQSSRVDAEIGVEYAEQYDGEKWNRIEAYAWMDGAWRLVSRARVMLYDRGTDMTDITGGWDKDENTGMTLTFGTESIALKITKDGDRYATAYTKKLIDVTEYRTLGMTVSGAAGRENSGSMYIGATINVYTGGTGAELLESFAAGTGRNVAPDKGNAITGETEIEVDISALEGACFIQFGAAVADATVHEIYLV